MVTGLIALSRPLNVLIGMISIFLAGVICSDKIVWPALLLACFSGGMIAAAANAINDFFDIEIDRINKPHRPLPSGKISILQALVFANGMGVAALFLTIFLNKLAFLIALSALVLLFLYSAKLKGTVIWGNILVSFITALAFIFGGAAVNSWRNALIPAGFALLMHFGREVLKDMEDVTGDRTYHAKTLAVVYGFPLAKTIVTVVFALLIVATFLPYIFEQYGLYYFILVLIGVDSVLLYVSIKIWRRSDQVTLHRLSELLKYDMFVGLLAIYLGRW